VQPATYTDTDIHTMLTCAVCKTDTFRSDWLWDGWYGDRIPVRATFAVTVQTGLGAHPASCAIGPLSLSGVKAAGVWR
jgi:hypothetical protein